ncbi:magnesium/cobalt transporter CorA [Paenibacillus cremeus]|uniref:Magnesium transport protein CorA n=1 Tax=Paenibacillus cremeus TaxID=2163881 RepID=A0A559KCA6_9BACL|nr:magnesium/cobalt transporter CorA [Paenibacillus cremeus]TVY09764.1 magnesium/cobalt transporter CorA [Paenibacillus cremeus]
MLLYEQSTGKVSRTDIRRPNDNETVWIHLVDARPEDVEFTLRDTFGCHPLVVEDCIKLNQRPKMDRYKDHIFITFFALTDKNLATEEIGIVIGRNYVVSISKKPLLMMDALSEHFLKMEGSMAHPGGILYRILDRCVDDYTSIINLVEDRMDRMERTVFRNPYVRVAQEIFQLKRMIHHLRRIIVEEKTILGAISHQNFPYMKQEADVYFIDIYDHISRVIDSLDIFRESLTGLLELQMSMKSDRMNETMKTLTVMSSIFLPLIFVVGLYGMNFKFIPELSWDYGYAYVWIVMICITLLMYRIFKWKKWL